MENSTNNEKQLSAMSAIMRMHDNGRPTPAEFMKQTAELGLDKFNLEPNQDSYWLLMDRFFPLPSAYAPKDNSEMWLRAIDLIGDKIKDMFQVIKENSKNEE